ncbi:MAG: aspartate aminotransferase family protein, partial [Gammaproteobacteria bacterium]|nr:aspartate aminotransferase family protein [Gammaproteobacteria bacterium]
LMDNVRDVSGYIQDVCRVGPVESIHGKGFLLGLKTKQRAAEVRDALLERNILAGVSADPHVLRLLPPLILQREHIDLLAEALGEIGDASV